MSMNPVNPMTLQEARAHLARRVKGRNKFSAKKVQADGHTFDSMAEHRRYIELKAMQQAGEIAHLTVHPVFYLAVQGAVVCRYEADFDYMTYPATNDHRRVTEDVKGLRKGAAWAHFRTKAKLFEALYGRPVSVYPPLVKKPRRKRTLEGR